MKLKLKEKEPMYRAGTFGISELIWFEAGEIFEVVETKVMKHDNKEWFKIKSKWFTNPMEGFHNPDSFEILDETP